MIILYLAVIGILLSLYALYVEQKVRKNIHYKAFCDISDHISCTKAVGSRYGKLLYLPNAFFGVLFYILIILFWSLPELQFILALVGLIISIVLAYISYILQKNFCLVCSTIYLVNILIFILTL